MSDHERPQPIAREAVLLYLAHFIRTGGQPGRDQVDDIFGTPVYTITPWRIETQISVWTFNQYGKRIMGSTLHRRWRALREPPTTRLDTLGVTVRERPPGDNEPDGYNKVWDLKVDHDAFLAALQERSPYVDYSF